MLRFAHLILKGNQEELKIDDLMKLYIIIQFDKNVHEITLNKSFYIDKSTSYIVSYSLSFIAPYIFISIRISKINYI